MKSDIFFFISSATTIFLTILVAIVLVYLIKILRDAKKISEQIKAETAAAAQDIASLRKTVKEEGEKIKKFVDFLATLSLGKYFTERKTPPKKRKKKV